MIENKSFLKKIIIVSTLIIATFLGLYIWPTFVVPELLKVPKDFTYTADLVSVDNFFDESIGQYSGEKYSNSSFSYQVVSYEGGIAKIQNNFEVRSFDGKKIFSASPIYGIDAKTWMHVKGQGDKDRDGYLFAPRGLKKDQTFRFWYVSTSVGANMKFVAEEELYGLKVYKYEKTNIDPVDQSAFFTHLQGVPEKRGVMLKNQLYLWIEPVSGYVVKQEEFSDDYYFFERATGKRLNTYNKFSNVYSEKSVIKHVMDARVEKYKAMFFTYGVPILIFLIFFLPILLRFVLVSRTKKIEFFGLIGVVILILITIAVTYFVNKSVNDSEYQILSEEANEVMFSLDRRFASYVDILRGAQGLIVSSDFVDRSEWSTYIKNLDLEKKYPGVQAMGYAHVVDQDKKSDFIAAIQKNDLSDFAIYPEKSTSIYVPILYIEPQVERNIKGVGYNFFSDENRRDALERATKTRDLAVTNKIELLNEPTNDTQPGFIMYLPVFRKSSNESSDIYTKQEVVGYVFAAFRMNDLMKDLIPRKIIDLDFHLFDGLRTVPQSLLFDYNPNMQPDIKTVFNRVDVLSVGDRVWAVEFFNNPDFQIEKTKKLLPWVILIGGIIFSILFYIVFYFLITTKERAEEIARKLTEELKKNEEILKEKNRIMEEQILESNKLNQLMIDRELAMVELKKKAQ